MEKKKSLETGISVKKTEESWFRKLILFRMLPIVLVLSSWSCLFLGWVQMNDSMRDDLTKILKYLSKGSSVMEKYLGINDVAGIDTSDLESMNSILSDGRLTPYEIYIEADTVKSAAKSLSIICKKMKITTNAGEALEVMALKVGVFHYLFFAVTGIAILTIFLILIRRKILGNWLFSISNMVIIIWFGLLIRTINEKTGSEYDLKYTIIPFLSLILSLPFIRYDRRKNSKEEWRQNK